MALESAYSFMIKYFEITVCTRYKWVENNAGLIENFLGTMLWSPRFRGLHWGYETSACGMSTPSQRYWSLSNQSIIPFRSSEKATIIREFSTRFGVTEYILQAGDFFSNFVAFSQYHSIRKLILTRPCFNTKYALKYKLHFSKVGNFHMDVPSNLPGGWNPGQQL